MHSLLFFIITLSLLVVIHEFGHFWVARRCGVKVLKFSVGFGKPLWSKLGRDGTEYILAVIPLGGYVKMLDQREADVPADQLEYAFNKKSLAARTAIVAAGPIANLLFAILAYWLIFVSGIDGIRPLIGEVIVESPASYAQFAVGDEIKEVNGVDTPTWSSVQKELFKFSQAGGVANIMVESGGIEIQRQLEMAKINLDLVTVKPILKELGLIPTRIKYKPVVGKVISGGAAIDAGLQVGDLLYAFDNKPVDNWHDWVDIIQAHPNMEMTIVVERAGDMITLSITPNKQAKIGVAVDVSHTEIPENLQAEFRYGAFAAIGFAVQQTWDISISILQSLAGMVAGQVSYKSIGGPIAIAEIVGVSAAQGLMAFISILALLSINLGILNLLPIPILDGGHLVLHFLEWIKGKPLSENTQMQAQKLGIILLLSLMVLAFSNDLLRLFGS